MTCPKSLSQQVACPIRMPHPSLLQPTQNQPGSGREHLGHGSVPKASQADPSHALLSPQTWAPAA